MEDNVSKEKKKNRLVRLNELVNKYYLENNEKLVGTIVPVFIENVSKKVKSLCACYIDIMKLVNVRVIKKIRKAKITKSKT